MYEDIGYFNLWGINTEDKFYFFYDETNNCRKFWIKPTQQSGIFNTNIYDDFVLGGVAYEGDKLQIDFEDLRDLLDLQKNVKEIKFKAQFSKSTFLDCMKKERVTKLLQWIEANNLYIHYFHVNNLYYALVEIVDSIMTMEEICDFNFDIFSIKNTFYKMLRGKESDLQKIMFKYCFPNIKHDDIEIFCMELLNLFDNRYELNMEEKFITGMIKRASKSDSLIFIQNNKDYIMQENYVEFYIDPIRTFRNSEHIFDEELEIQKILEGYRFVRQGVEVNTFKFINSKSDVLVQISDVIVGIIGKLLSYINNSELNTIRQEIETLNESQIKNIMLLDKLRSEADKRNKGFLHSITAQCEIDKLNQFLGMVMAKNKNRI